jgi:hypothetical protein
VSIDIFHSFFFIPGSDRKPPYWFVDIINTVIYMTMHLQTVIYATISVLFHSLFTTHDPHHEPPVSICLDGSNSIYLWISDFRPHQTHSRAVMLHTRQVVHLLLMLSGQVELNQGLYTPKFPCQICSKVVKWGQRALACDNWDQWCHTECVTMTSEEYHHLA